MEDTSFASATPADLSAVRLLLDRCGLPTGDLEAKHLEHFLLCRVGGQLAGAIGLEVLGCFGLIYGAPHARRFVWLSAGIAALASVFAILYNTDDSSAYLIPTYLVVRDLGLLNSYWALILPLAINPFYLVIVKTFFQELPEALEEAARIDGCNELSVFRRIVLPLSKPIIATFSLFYATAIWNDYMSPLLYLNDERKWTLQVLVRQLTAQNADGENVLNVQPTDLFPQQGLKFAVIVLATVPILLVYPFLQKHFAKGVLIGSVKE